MRGWIFAGTFMARLETADWPLDAEVRRYAKRLLLIVSATTAMP